MNRCRGTLSQSQVTITLCLKHASRIHLPANRVHYTDVIMGAITSQITSLTIVYSTVYSDAAQRKHQSSASLAFVSGIHQGPVNSLHKWPVTRKRFPFNDVIICIEYRNSADTWALWCIRSLCVRYLPVSGGFPSPRSSYVESVSMVWRHHGITVIFSKNIFLEIHRHLYCSVTIQRRAIL